MGWFISRSGAQTGPYGDEQLRQMAVEGQLAATDYLWQEGGQQRWLSVSEMREMFPPGSRFLQEGPAHDPALRWIMPVGRSGWAIAAGYLGLFAVLFVFAPFSLLVGIIAIADIKKHPEKLGMGRAIFGVVMGAIFSVLLVVALASYS